MAEQSGADYRGNLGRYALYGEIAAGGMATVHLARLLGPVGFARTVAIKRLHPHLAKDPDFVAMFLEEARLAARVKHPNVVSTLDVVSDDGELFLVMEYVAGESLSRLVRKTREAGERVPPRFVVSMVCGALDGLHAAHEATGERGAPLGLVHRDVSPQNIHVGLDGVARVLDFGIAKATNRVQETRTDQIKGKVAYMSPEQLAKGAIDRRADVYSAAVVLWEALTSQRLFKADDVPSLVYAIVNDAVRKPSELVPDLPPGLDEIVLKGLAKAPEERWSSAREMAEALERALPPAPPREIGEWVKQTAGEALEWRMDLLHQIESETSSSMPPPLRIDSPPSPVEVASGVVPNGGEEADAEPDAEARDAGEREAVVVASTRTPAPSVVDDSTEMPAQRSKLGVAMVVLAALLLVGGGGVFAYRWVEVQSEPSGPTAEPTAPTAAAHHESEPAIVLGLPRASASASGSSAPAAPSATAKVTPTVTVVPPTAPTTKPTATRPAPPPSDECDNPFVIDSRGIRHPKPHCFKR